ncbi:MAG TPA: helix-turn-helix transcriptional regulator [Streptosporangiaceae bacterium]|nr:helix-turn-helix transcriptional regulator [Streptosporangiaceae bacterium]
MSVRESIDPKASLWDWLAYDLWFYRTKRGLSLAQVAAIMDCTRGTVSNIEAGRLKLNDKQAKALDAAWETGGHFERLLWFARTGHDPDWFKQYTRYAAEAWMIKIYHGQLIPSPFQIAAYARALLAPRGEKDLDKLLEARLARQAEVMERDTPPKLWLLLDEGALERAVGGPEVMREQLGYLLHVADQPNVTVRVNLKSSGAHPGLDGPFQIFGLAGREAAYAGAQIGGRLIEAGSEVRTLSIEYDQIGAESLPQSSSRGLIRQLMEIYQ